jgi:hypothetical protein
METIFLVLCCNFLILTKWYGGPNFGGGGKFRISRQLDRNYLECIFSFLYSWSTSFTGFYPCCVTKFSKSCQINTFVKISLNIG